MPGSRAEKRIPAAPRPRPNGAGAPQQVGRTALVRPLGRTGPLTRTSCLEGPGRLAPRGGDARPAHRKRGALGQAAFHPSSARGGGILARACAPAVGRPGPQATRPSPAMSAVRQVAECAGRRPRRGARAGSRAAPQRRCARRWRGVEDAAFIHPGSSGAARQPGGPPPRPRDALRT